MLTCFLQGIISSLPYTVKENRRNSPAYVRVSGLWYNAINPHEPREPPLETIDIARKVVEAASEKQATDITLLDVRKVCSFASYFVICSGESERQISAIHSEIEQTLKKDRLIPQHREGTLDSGWMLLDYGDIVIHIFAAAEREYYHLDELWSKAVPVIRMQ